MGEEWFPVTLRDAGPGEFGIGTWRLGEVGMCPALSPPRPLAVSIFPNITSVSRAALAAVRGL